MRALATGSYYTYIVDRIAGEVAVCDSQGPRVVDRSAAAVHLQIATEKLEIPGQAGRNIAS